jgi:pantoate kinase
MKSLQEIHQVMLDCLDVDDMEAGKIRLQHILSDEELQAMRDFNEDYKKKVAELYKKHSLGIINESQLVKQEYALMEEKHNILTNGDTTHS